MRKVFLGFFVASLIFVLLLFWKDHHLSQKDETIPTVQDQQFLAKIKKDISFDKEIVLSVGPYEGLKNISLNNGVVISVDFESPAYIVIKGSTYYILIDYDFYMEITQEERKYVIAHEIGHAYYNLFSGIEAQKKADMFTLQYQYAKPGVIIDFMKKYCKSQEECQERINNVLSFKQG